MSLQFTNLEALRQAIANAAAKETETPSAPVPRVSAADEKQQLEIDGLKSKLDGVKDDLKRLGHIHIARMVGLGLLFLLILGWLTMILIFVYWSGTPADWKKEGGQMILKLSEPVIIALIGSTTVNVIALFVIAAKWLYGDQKRTDASDAHNNG